MTLDTGQTTQPLWERDTSNPKPRGRQWETTPAKFFPRHDMSKGKTCCHKPAVMADYCGRMVTLDCH